MPTATSASSTAATAASNENGTNEEDDDDNDDNDDDKACSHADLEAPPLPSAQLAIVATTNAPKR
jgi:hypothetical protein